MTRSGGSGFPRRQHQQPPYVVTVAQMSRVAADRARRFSTLEVKPRWATLLGTLTLPPLWVVQMLVASVQAGQIRILGDASATLRGPRTTPRPWGLTVAGFVPAVVSLVVLEGAALLVPNITVNLVCWVILLLAVIVLLRDLVRGRRRVRNHPEAKDAALMSRRNELGAAGAPVFVLIALVARRDEQRNAWNLIEALKDEWKEQGAAVVLFPATDSLVGYYERLGAVIDGPRGRSMLFDYRH